MDPYTYSLEEISLTRPSGQKLVQHFLSQHSLDFDTGLEKYYGVFSGTTLVGGIGRQANILKCAAVDANLRGEGLLGALVSRAVADMKRAGIENIFVFTKPDNKVYFHDLGFSPVETVANVILMESDSQAFTRYLNNCATLPHNGKTGAVVMNCNPFTLGHRYLVQHAAEQCDSLLVFVVEEDASEFPFTDRIRLVREGTADIPGVTVTPGGAYIISAATFPSYFLKDSGKVSAAHTELDLTIFGKHIAPAARITQRFAGEEPLCPVTASYNQAMLSILPPLGVDVHIIPRKTEGDEVISASRVRSLFASKRFEELHPLVPESTYAYLRGL